MNRVQASYLGAVQDTLDRLAAIHADARRQVMELAAFVSGERTSSVPLGKLFLMNIGSEILSLERDIEQWIK